MTATRLEPRTTFFVNKHSTFWPNWPNDWDELWILICAVHLTLFLCHVICMLKSEFTLYICLNGKQILTRKRLYIWLLSDCNGSRTHNHLVCKLTVIHLGKLTKWLSWIVSSYLYVRLTVYSSSPTYQFQCASTLYMCQNIKKLLTRKWRFIYIYFFLKLKWLQRESKPQPLSS